MDKYIQIRNNDKIVIYKLNESEAAKDLYGLLPIKNAVENFSHNEKIVYLPKSLNTENTPKSTHGIETLSYFAPWDNLVFYYDEFGPYSGLYKLGECVQGQKNIKEFNGIIEITKYQK